MRRAVAMVLAGGMIAAGCGASSHAASGPTAKFNACVGHANPSLSASGHPVAGGAAEPIVDQGSGIAGNVWLYHSHAAAVANANVMTGYPIRIVRGAYMVDVNTGIDDADSTAIQGCASQIPDAGE